MRIVTLEEHITFPEIVEEIKQLLPPEKIKASPAVERLAGKLKDITGERLQSMDEQCISMQVLSVAGPGADLLHGQDAIAIAQKYNDAIANEIKGNENRFAVFAHLPTNEPDAAATEMERTVTKLGFKGALISGLSDEVFLDDPKFAPIFEKAQELDVPIYLHPGLPPEAVLKAYYSNLPNHAGELLSIAGWGWHSETALHVLRLIVSGTLDKYPRLKLIIGHMGEMLPMMMIRCDNVMKPGKSGAHTRTISQTLKDQVYITTSGLFTKPPLQIALDTFGIDKVLFSIDYPFSTNETGKKFLDSLSLSNEDMEKLTHGNADKLLKL